MPVPPMYRGTVVAKQFESGKLGGTKVTERRMFADTPEQRRALQAFVRHHERVEIVYVGINARARGRQKITRAQVLRPGFLMQVL